MAGDNMQQLLTTMMTYSVTQLNQLVLSGSWAAPWGLPWPR